MVDILNTGDFTIGIGQYAHICAVKVLSRYTEIALLLLSVTNCDKQRLLKLKGGITGR